MDISYAFDETTPDVNWRRAATALLGAMFCLGFVAGFIVLGGPRLIGADHPSAAAASLHATRVPHTGR